MCGIVGFIGKCDNNKQVIEKMSKKIAHRGPDGEGFFIDNDVALAHRRLSIIDINIYKQIMYNVDEYIVIKNN